MVGKKSAICNFMLESNNSNLEKISGFINLNFVKPLL